LPETGLDRADADAAANPHKLAESGKTRHRLGDGRAFAEVMQRGRTQRRGLGKGRGVLHDPRGKARHGDRCPVRV